MASDSQKTSLLFKEFTGVVNAQQNATFEAETYPFRPYVTNEEIFSSDISANLADISYNVGTPTFPVYVYGIAALDASYGSAVPPSTYFDASFIVAPNLVYYHKQELANATGIDSRTWYVDPGDGTKRSLAADTIPFLYDPEYNSFKQQLYENGGASADAMGEGTLVWLMDYMSGFVEFYGDEAGVNAWVTANGPPRLSYVKYIGEKGAAGGGGTSSGGDASFNTVDISGAGILWRSKLSSSPYSLVSARYLSLARTFAVVNEDYFQTNPLINFNAALRFVLYGRLTNGDSQRVEGYASYAAEGDYNSTGGSQARFNYRRARVLVTDNAVKGSSVIFDNINIVDEFFYNATLGPNQYTYYAFLQAHTTSNAFVFDELTFDIYENGPNVQYVATFPATGDPQYNAPTVPPTTMIDWWDVFPSSDVNNSTSGVSGTTQVQADLTTKTLMYDTADSSYFTNLDASMANINELNAVVGNVTTLTATTAVADDLTANDNFTVGTSVDPQIKWNTVKFYLDGNTPSPGVDDWVTIAQIGPDVNNSGAAMRGEAHFRVQDRLSGRHQSTDIFVTQEYSRGISLEAKVTGYASSTPLPFKAVRVASGNTYEGGVLQLQVAVAGLTGSSNPFWLMMMDSTNNPSWQTIANATFLNTDNTPTTYNAAYAGNLLSTFTSVPIDTATIAPITAPTQTRNVGSVTTVSEYYKNARLQVHEEGIYAYSDGVSGAGTIQSIGGFIRVEEPINGDVLDISFDSVSGASLITNVESSTNPLDINIVASGGIDISGNNGNVVLNSNGDVALNSSGDVLAQPAGTFDANAPGGIYLFSDPGFIDISGEKVTIISNGTSNEMVFGTASSSADAKIRGGQHLYLTSGQLASGAAGSSNGNIYITAKDQALIYGQRQGTTAPGVVLGTTNTTYRHNVKVDEPLGILTSSSSSTMEALINGLSDTYRFGNLYQLNDISIPKSGPVVSLINGDTTKDARFQCLVDCCDRMFLANLNLRRYVDSLYNTVTNGGSARFHHVSREPIANQSKGATTGDYLRMYAEKEAFDIWVNGVTLYPYHHYNHTPSVTTSGTIYFEVWIGRPGPASPTVTNTSYAYLITSGGTWFDSGVNWLDPNISSGISWNPLGSTSEQNSTAILVSRISKSVTTTGTGDLYLPFTTNTSSAPSNSNMAPVINVLTHPFRISSGTPWSVFVVERSAGGSINLASGLGPSGTGYENAGTGIPHGILESQLGVCVHYSYNLTG